MSAVPAPHRPTLIDRLYSALPPSTGKALDALVRAAERRRQTLYLVGGGVRDLLLRRDTLDVDLTLEGDGPALARAAASKLRAARCVTHAAFGTATLAGPGYRLDVASARAETYARPGALPTVRPGSLHDDLFRRDFTVNAMALPLSGERRGRIVDPFGGRPDLRAGFLRVLHETSFQDDATRILRGARYESRLGFRFERKTLRWLKRDAGYLTTISGPRIREELLRVLREPEPERILRRLQRLGALAAIHPALSFDASTARAFRRLRRLTGNPASTAYLSLLARPLTSRQAAALASRLALTRRETEAVLAAPRGRRLEAQLARAVKPSSAVNTLSTLPLPAAWALAAAAGRPARDRTLAYLRRWRHLRLSLDGHDLQAMGMRPGPRLGRVLERLREAKLDGEVRTRHDEERLALRLLARSGRR
jgi:tRNA nucleotidyltransferase (CCA-adding enzyme)